MRDGRPFVVAGLWSDAPDPATGEAGDSYALVIGEANAAMRVHDRMPAILPNAAAREWLEPGPLRPGLRAPPPRRADDRLAGRRRRLELPAIASAPASTFRLRMIARRGSVGPRARSRPSPLWRTAPTARRRGSGSLPGQVVRPHAAHQRHRGGQHAGGEGQDQQQDVHARALP
jgi:SOS response associated peptidase (SRAP)